MAEAEVKIIELINIDKVKNDTSLIIKTLNWFSKFNMCHTKVGLFIIKQFVILIIKIKSRTWLKN